jgi:hypothetical protein
MPIPDTAYAMAGDSAIAYQVFGSGEHRMVARAPRARTIGARLRGHALGTDGNHMGEWVAWSVQSRRYRDMGQGSTSASVRGP